MYVIRDMRNEAMCYKWSFQLVIKQMLHLRDMSV